MTAYNNAVCWRNFVDENLVVDAWEKIETYYNDLLERDISEKSAFEKWLRDISELEATSFFVKPETAMVDTDISKNCISCCIL